MAAEALLKAIEHYAHHTRYKFFCVYLRRISDLFYTQKYMSPQEYSAWTNGFRSGQNAEEGSAQIACFEHMAEAAPESLGVSAMQAFLGVDDGEGAYVRGFLLDFFAIFTAHNIQSLPLPRPCIIRSDPDRFNQMIEQSARRGLVVSGNPALLVICHSCFLPSPPNGLV